MHGYRCYTCSSRHYWQPIKFIEPKGVEAYAWDDGFTKAKDLVSFATRMIQANCNQTALPSVDAMVSAVILQVWAYKTYKDISDNRLFKSKMLKTTVMKKIGKNEPFNFTLSFMTYSRLNLNAIFWFYSWKWNLFHIKLHFEMLTLVSI